MAKLMDLRSNIAYNSSVGYMATVAQVKGFGGSRWWPWSPESLFATMIGLLQGLA